MSSKLECNPLRLGFKLSLASDLVPPLVPTTMTIDHSYIPAGQEAIDRSTVALSLEINAYSLEMYYYYLPKLFAPWHKVTFHLASLASIPTRPMAALYSKLSQETGPRLGLMLK